ncbi:MAG TPA: class I fructose-bisphosphate aldolase [Anaerolineales bacterium]|nr:class I fructose-bisphosphate aldolase [Anaerolineales bacterium]
MNKGALEGTARAMVPAGKGILAADESTGTIRKRFTAVGIADTEENRRAYREMLFTTPGMEDYISGVILFDETLRQSAGEGTPFPALLAAKGILPGIKPDRGAKDMAGHPSEKVTEGLDGLRERLAEYRDLGVRFGKWRAVITIGEGLPSLTCLQANAEALARYAALCQEQGLVPIVEPEVLMDGDHSLERCAEVTELTLRIVFDRLADHRIHLEGTILKPNMVIPGKGHSHQAASAEVAEATVSTLLRCVPAAVPGIVFLSGGQTPQQATENLNAINARFPSLPWEISFSYGRALQDEALRAWLGQREKTPAAQAAFYHRARNVGAARAGRYSTDMEAA